jgi:hypothetical protein
LICRCVFCQSFPRLHALRQSADWQDSREGEHRSTCQNPWLPDRLDRSQQGSPLKHNFEINIPDQRRYDGLASCHGAW